MKIIEAERLRLRPWGLEDVEAAFAMYGDPEVMRFLLSDPLPDLEAQRERLEKIIANYNFREDGYGFWAIELRESGDVVGSILLKPLPGHEEIEIGWHQARKAWGNGYVTEGAKACLRYALEELRLERVVAVVHPDNHRSQAVAKRIGLQHSGRIIAYDHEVELFVTPA